MNRFSIPLLLVGIAVFCTSCRSATDICATCPPKTRTVDVETPIPCVIPIGVLPGLVLPPLPTPPDFTTATDDQVDAWLADLKTAIDRREAMLLARVTALGDQIETHNRLEPKCEDVR